MKRVIRFACVLALWTSLSHAGGAPLEFRVVVSPEVVKSPFSGRVYVLLGQDEGEPRFGPNWFNPSPMMALDVVNAKPGEEIGFSKGAVTLPANFSAVKSGSYNVQAVLDRDLGPRDALGGAGNCYSKPQKMEIDVGNGGPVKLVIDQISSSANQGTRRRRGGGSFVESDRVKLAELQSDLLTKFYGKPTNMVAGVVLPESYETNNDRRYPVLFDIPGFGGTHHGAPYATGRTNVAGTEFIYIVLNPDCRLGHHVFADSDNNGPVGKALVEEFIPYIEKNFRTIAKPAARLLTGHSSGGWSSLWLQVTYPDYFGGTWSTSPDPVDFRDFQRINIYQPGENMFVDGQGQPRPLARAGDRVLVTYKQFSDMENVVNRGGQLTSFEAVFSTKGADGRPRKLWNRETGAIDLSVAEEWKRYDIRMKLEKNWPTLKPKLAGKLHVYMGDMDTFYLEGATRLLQESLAQLGSDAKVELFAGKDHGSVMTASLRKRIAEEMAAAVKDVH